LSREVTTKSVRSVPRCEQRNRSSVSGTAASVHDRLQVGVGLVAA
jgi:hypothetical protein